MIIVIIQEFHNLSLKSAICEKKSVIITLYCIELELEADVQLSYCIIVSLYKIVYEDKSRKWYERNEQ